VSTYGEGDDSTMVPDCGPLLILVAEDVEENAELLKVRLEALGHKLMHVDNGAKAVALFPQHAFDLILMDIQMPVMHGLAASREIRKLPGGERIPILALTASVLPENRQACHNAGMNGFITKPLMFEELFAEMARVLNVRLIAQANMTPRGEVSVAAPVGVVNLQKALRNWQSQEVYVRALELFLRSSESDIEKLNDALVRNDFDDLNARIHALKGVAGNLALDNCYEHAVALSACLKSRAGDYRQWIRSIDDALKAVRDTLPLLQNAAANGEPEIESPQQVLQDMKKLDETFAKADTDEQVLARVVAYLRHRGADEGGIQRLKYASEEFEFERARAVLGDIARGLQLSWS
jgi:CheY-like chemotaxis protein